MIRWVVQLDGKLFAYDDYRIFETDDATIKNNNPLSIYYQVNVNKFIRDNEVIDLNLRLAGGIVYGDDPEEHNLKTAQSIFSNMNFNNTYHRYLIKFKDNKFTYPIVNLGNKHYSFNREEYDLQGAIKLARTLNSGSFKYVKQSKTGFYVWTTDDKDPFKDMEDRIAFVSETVGYHASFGVSPEVKTEDDAYKVLDALCGLH